MIRGEREKRHQGKWNGRMRCYIVYIWYLPVAKPIMQVGLLLNSGVNIPGQGKRDEIVGVGIQVTLK